MSKGPDSFRVPIRYLDTDKDILHVNSFFVTHTNNEFFISFAQTHPPYKLKLDAKEIEELQKTGVPAKIVFRLAMTPEQMKDFANQLKDNYKKFKDSQEV